MPGSEINDRLSTLIDEKSLQARIQELGAQIREEYGDEPITCIGVLKGSFLFMADLVRAIEGQVTFFSPGARCFVTLKAVTPAAHCEALVVCYPTAATGPSPRAAAL